MKRNPGGGLDWSNDEQTRADPTAAKLSLICRVGPISVGTVFGSDGAPITIGRAAGCAIVLPIAESSRRHSRIEYRGGRFWVSDLDTLNGTRVNGTLVQEATPLEEDDVVDVCGQHFQVKLRTLPGRKVVYDGFDALQVVNDIQTTPLDVARPAPWPAPQPAAAPPARAPSRFRWPRALGFALAVGVTAVLASGTAILVASRMMRPAPLQPAPQPPIVSQQPVVVTPIGPTTPPPRPEPRNEAIPPATVVAVDVLIVPTHASGVVKEVAPLGTPVSANEYVADLEDSSVEHKRRQLERMRARYGDSPDYAEFIEQAQHDVDKARPIHIRTPAAGIVVAAAVKPEQKIHRGDEVVRVAGKVQLRIDAFAVTGAGPACKITVAGKPGIALDGTLAAEPDGTWRTITLARLPPGVAPGPLGDARAECDRK